MRLTAYPSQKAHFVEACMSPKPKSKAGVGLFGLQFPAHTHTRAPVNTIFRWTVIGRRLQARFHAKATGLSEVEGQRRGVQPPGNPRSRVGEAGLPATGPRALIPARIPILRQGTAELYPNNPASSVPGSQTATSLTPTKVAHFPLVWVNRSPSQSIRNEPSFRFWWQGPCCQRRGQQHQTKETVYHLSSSRSRPSSIKTHSCCCLLACCSFKVCFHFSHRA